MPEAGLDAARVAAGSHGFMLPVRVYYEDTDAGGIVYHANYLRFAERARTEMLRALGIDQSELRARDGLGFVVRRCTVEFNAPARLDDLLEVRCAVGALRGAAIEMVQDILRSGETKPLVSLNLVVALVDADGRPRRMPRDLRELLSGNAG